MYIVRDTRDREEPAMTPTLINPAGLHDPVGYGYSHLAAAGKDLVFVAGQYASGPDGTVPTPDFTEQVELAFRNLGTALAAAGLGYEHVARLGTYIVDHDEAKLGALLGVIRRIWGERPPAQTLLGVARLALPDMLVEVDAVAVRGKCARSRGTRAGLPARPRSVRAASNRGVAAFTRPRGMEVAVRQGNRVHPPAAGSTAIGFRGTRGVGRRPGYPPVEQVG